MKRILFFVMLLWGFAVRSEVLPDANGWYSVEKERDAVIGFFAKRAESCLAKSIETSASSSMVVRMYTASDDESSVPVTGPMTILLYGPDAADKSGLDTPFGYRNTGALLVPTIAMNDAWFCAELRHMYAHLIRSIGVEGEEDPVTELQLFALEEISVREDMRDYLNKKTSGRYASVLESVLEQKGESSIGIEEQIRMLNEVFPPSLSPEEQGIRIEQFQFDLKLGRLIRISEKVDAYISLIQPSTNP